MSKLPLKKQRYSLLESFCFALSGLWFALRWERNLRIHLAVAGYLLYFSLRYYHFSRGEWALLVLTIGGVIVCELLNTAIEKTVDCKTPDYNQLAKIAKDVAAGAVFVSALGSLLVGVLLFWDPPTFQQIVGDLVARLYLWIPLVAATLVVIFLPEKKHH